MNLKDAGIYDLVNIFKGEPTAAHMASQGGIINQIPRVINIPAYQRPYRWGPDNITRLFMDYDENQEEYFLGSAVAVEQRKAGDSIEFDIVDGQQRITTLYLLNYIRFLLKREYVLEKISKSTQLIKANQYCNELRDYYVNMVGKNDIPFVNIQKKIDELAEDETILPEESVGQLVACYKKELCIPELKSTPQETLDEKQLKAREFFDNEQLCLKYSRPRYDKVLRDALCTVYLKTEENTNNYMLAVLTETKDDPFIENYLNALKTIFECVWSRAVKAVDPDTASLTVICEKAIQLLDDIIKNMSLCIVLTENENDANKLFEVLNDRSLDVEDLELIKNHFYKEYCTKSDDTDEEKDKRITELDELWADKIFSSNGEVRNKLISYFATIYFTCETELAYKDGAKLKDAIEKGYSSKVYTLEGKKYTYEDILADFNVYYAVKIILDTVGFRAKKLPETALDAEQQEKSITYKTFHLLNALKYIAVLPALINVIISTYVRQEGCSLTAADFETSFRDFVDKLCNDKAHTETKYEKIHRCAYMLWVAAIKGKDYTIPRTIAKRIIAKYGRDRYSADNMDFEGAEVNDLDLQFSRWLDEWTYGNNKMFVVKILLLQLLLSKRTPDKDGYKASRVELELHGDLTYRLDAGKLQLDHLEANVINNAAPDRYYLSEDREKRQKDVNMYLGNFMILDAADNNSKKNVPLSMALAYYAGIDKSWLIEDIHGMLKEEKYFDPAKNIPTEEFFKFRSKQLKKYFKALLKRQWLQRTVTVELD